MKEPQGINERAARSSARPAKAASRPPVGHRVHVQESVTESCRDEAKALGYLKRACDLGMAQACRWLKEQQRTAAN